MLKETKFAQFVGNADYNKLILSLFLFLHRLSRDSIHLCHYKCSSYTFDRPGVQRGFNWIVHMRLEPSKRTTAGKQVWICFGREAMGKSDWISDRVYNSANEMLLSINNEKKLCFHFSCVNLAWKRNKKKSRLDEAFCFDRGRDSI